MKISVYTSFDDDPSTVAPTFGGQLWGQDYVYAHYSGPKANGSRDFQFI